MTKANKKKFWTFLNTIKKYYTITGFAKEMSSKKFEIIIRNRYEHITDDVAIEFLDVVIHKAEDLQDKAIALKNKIDKK